MPAAVVASYLLGEASEHLINAGAEQALDNVILREGSVLQPWFPPPLGLRGITLMRHMAVCLGLTKRHPSECLGGCGKGSWAAAVKC